MSRAWTLVLAAFCLIGLLACSPGIGPDGVADGLDGRDVNAPWRHWQPAGDPEAVVLTLHGFNDYSNAFVDFAAYSEERNVAVHAYDQRGFGANPDRGRWAGMERMTGDLKAAAAHLRKIYGDVPLYVLGESMGGAVAIVAATEDAAETLDVDGLILSAPAVWGGKHMNVFYRLTLWLSSTIAPAWTLTGGGLDIRPSDNIEMLRALGADPLVIKGTRTDAIAGLVALMDRALASAPALDRDLLLLIGEKDEIIPPGALDDFQHRLTGDAATAISYPEGYHMLLRDLQRARVFEDILTWIGQRKSPEIPGHTKAVIEYHAPVETGGSKIKS